MMKKPMGMVSALAIASAAAFGGISDRVVVFSTPGPDRYADGSKVLDGECYALVWSPAGEVFGGFNADGTAVNAADRVVLAGALAKNGKCMEAIFQVPEEEYKELSGGEWAVCLLDTRRQDGSLAGVVDGKPQRVNRWGQVKNEVKISTASTTLALDSIAAPKAGGRSLLAAAAPLETGACADTLSAVPDSVTQPRITGFEVVDGVARLTVEGTVPFLTYTISAGDTPDALTADDAAGSGVYPFFECGNAPHPCK